MSSFESNIELEIEVDFTFTRGMKGTRDRYGVPEEPDDDDEIEINSVNVKVPISTAGKVNFKNVDISEFLTKEQMDALEQEAWDVVSHDEPDCDDRDE